jgi:hypothetical protein
VSPWNREYNAADHGYARLAIGADLLTTDYMASDISVPDAGTVRIERFTQAAGTNTVQREPRAAARV